MTKNTQADILKNPDGIDVDTAVIRLGRNAVGVSVPGYRGLEPAKGQPAICFAGYYTGGYVKIGEECIANPNSWRDAAKEIFSSMKGGGILKYKFIEEDGVDPEVKETFLGALEKLLQ